MTIYSQSFYERHQDGMRRSARVVVPIMCDLLQPKSVIDVGCGVGTWLSVFRHAGVEDIFGMDGEWVNKAQLEIPVEKFLRVDLANPVAINRQFDLVVCLEVAEHLPQDRAESFINFLTHLGPAILFSAAIPHQGGSNHVNEQWPEYWIQYFQARDYRAIDAVRRKVWLDENVEWWYAQNTFIFARADHIARFPSLQAELQRTSVPQFSLVHPKAYLEAVEWNHKVHLMARYISALLTPDDTFIFVDDGQFRHLMAAGRRVWPFLERNGEYWGAPTDDATAIHELERMRALGARFIVFAWSTFWWFAHYREFHNYLRSKFRCTAENDHIVAFELSLASR